MYNYALQAVSIHFHEGSALPLLSSYTPWSCFRGPVLEFLLTSNLHKHDGGVLTICSDCCGMLYYSLTVD